MDHFWRPPRIGGLIGKMRDVNRFGGVLRLGGGGKRGEAARTKIIGIGQLHVKQKAGLPWRNLKDGGMRCRGGTCR